MKNLKDYLGKKVAIACRTDDEAKFVNDFLANNGGRSLYSDWENRKNKNKEYHNCLEFGLDDLPYNCYCYEGYYEKQGYTVYEASEFMEDNTSLVGRYVKALVDKPSSIGFCKKGDCYLIEEDDTNILCIKNVITQIGDWLISKKLIGVEWELMPIGFNPNQLEKSFTIQLNSQEELDAIMSFYKEKGYKMFGSSDYYCKGFVVYINPKDKTWQTIVNKNNYPFKTLSELGIILNNTPEFEIGKWYKNIGKDNKAYAKCLRYDGVNFYISEYIGHDKSYNLYENSSYFTKENYSKATLLTDLSEIQQYLPKGHPDKIVNNNSMYKVGDYLTVLSRIEGNSNIDDVIKITSIEKENYKGNGKNTNWVNYLNIQTKNTGAFRLEAFTNSLRKAKLEEIKTDLLSEDELLEVAKQFYPIGTKFRKFRTIYGDDKLLTVTENNHINSKSETDFIAVSTDKGNGRILHNSAAIWSKSKGWAKIINSPIQESDDFILPEKWCIKRNTEGNNIVTDWINNKFNTDYICKKFSDDYYYSNRGHGSELYGIEITFEQFKKYVLGKSEVMEKSWTEVSLDMMQKSLTTSYPLTPDECYTSKNLLNPEIIPIKVRNLPKFETPTRVKTVIIEPELLKI